MRGHIVKRSVRSWTIVLSTGRDATTGKRERQWVSVKGTRKDAEKRLTELLGQLDGGGYVRPVKETLGGFLQRWVKDYAWANLAPKTADSYESIVRVHVAPALGNVALHELRPAHLQRYYGDELKAGRSGLAVHHDHALLHRALATAVKQGLLMRNPADAVDAPKGERKEMRTLSADDLARFLDAKTTPYYPIFYTACYTGMRRSELLGLQWQDVDLILGEVSVRRTLHNVKGKVYLRPPKTAKSKRLIPLPPSATLVLRQHREQREADRELLGKPLTGEDFVFARADGSLLHPTIVTHAWEKLVRRLGLRGVRLHDARHTHASLMLKAGVHPKVVQERLGHSTIAITLDTYSHVAPGLQEAAARKFDDVVKQERQVSPAA
jgi:integrase